MAQNFKIDQMSTFAAPLMLLQCDPKLEMGSDKQAKSADGTPKWEVQFLAIFTSNFGKNTNEILKAGIASHTNPAQGIAPYTQVIVDDLELGVMEKTKKNQDGSERIIGVTVWHRATALRPATAPAAAPVRGKSDAA